MCTNAPRPLTDLADLAATPVAATPLPRSYRGVGPVDPETAQEIRATVTRIIACLDSGDPTRAYTDFGDAYLQRLLTPALLATLGTPTAAETNDDPTRIIAIDPILWLADGRILATVRLDPTLIPVEKTYQFVFIQNGDHWLLDDVVDELRFSLP